MIEASIRETVAWPVTQQPMIMAVVDTEAEFDWLLSRSRQACGVTSVRALRQVQTIFERHNVRPTFVVDYPISTIPEGYKSSAIFTRPVFAKSGRICIPGMRRRLSRKLRTEIPIQVI